MTAITFTATRVVVSGHTVGVPYVFDLPCQSIEVSGTPTKETQTSLSGRKQSLRFYRETFYDVTARPLRSTQLQQLQEFLISCEAEELFTWDPYGSVAVPGTVYSATLDSGGNLSQQRYQPRGQGGGNDYFVVNFRVRVLEP